MKLHKINNLQMNVTNQSSENFKNDNIWGVGLGDMQLIIKYNNELDFYYVQLIFLHGLFFWKIKKELVLLMHFNKV